MVSMKKILLQGAMDSEIKYLIEQVKVLPEYECVSLDGMEFHQGTLDDKIIFVNQTGMGTVKASMATTYAIQMFHPTMVINQGTAGAQIRELGTGDLVLVEEAVNINALAMPKKDAGEGCDPFAWTPRQKDYYKADELLLEVFQHHEESYSAGKIMRGNVATGDIYSRESDRIVWLEEQYHTLCEDMETAAVFEVCQHFDTPCAGLRVISNNELLGEEFNKETAFLLQKFVWSALAHF
jgi:adenosylhomocysteine nucleosidase